MNKFNYHIIDVCNFKCRYCFQKTCNKKSLSLEEAKNVVLKIKKYFVEHKIKNGEINIAGGEPLLYKDLIPLMIFIHKQGIKVSIITNGSLLNKKFIDRCKGIVSTIGISIDSSKEETRKELGCIALKDKSFSNTDYLELANMVHEEGIKLKINTVVTKLNYTEDMYDFICSMKPDRWKVLKIHVVKDVNENTNLEINDVEFNIFVEQHKSIENKIVEGTNSMENSYIMIDSQGHLKANDGGKYIDLGDVREISIDDALKKANFDETKYNCRYKK